MTTENEGRAAWYKVAEVGELAEGRVKSVTCGVKTLCLTHFQGRYAALDNKCPHQGDPLGEGSIENGYLRCPWHGTAAIFAAASRQIPEDAIIAVDVGNNTYSFGRYFECRRQAILMSGYLGSIGFSLPAAMGAWAATSLVNPSFADYAGLCGALGIRVEDPEELDDAMARALAHDGPSLVEMISDPELV